MIELTHNQFYLDTRTNQILCFDDSCGDLYYFLDNDGAIVVLEESELNYIIIY